MNKFMSMTEETLKPNNSLIISTTQNSEFGVSFYKRGTTATEADWYLSVGDGENGIISEVTSYNNNGETYYEAKVKFFLFDYYKWSGDSSEGDLYDLHVYGLAQTFLSYGIYETEVTWKKCSRFPLSKSDVYLDQITFNNVVDKKLDVYYQISP